MDVHQHPRAIDALPNARLLHADRHRRTVRVESLHKPSVRDDRDIVALNPLDAEYFPADPSIVNNDRVRNKTDNRHGIVGYLNDREVAAQIAAAVAG